MKSKILKSLYSPISEEHEKALIGDNLNDIPICINPFEYVGLGEFLPEQQKLVPTFLELERTPHTTSLRPIFDVFSGDILEYVDVPIEAVSQSSGDADMFGIVGPEVSLKFKNLRKDQEKTDFGPFLEPLNSGIGLLSSPMQSESIDETNSLVSLPDAPEFTPTRIQPDTFESEQDLSTSKAIFDEYSIDTFDIDVPNPAMKFTFKLDAFQIRSVYRLERNEIVFVSAPTASGKTFVAQYAIALSRSRKMKSIYTSPIKALSNQKFRDFKQCFGDVGIITGDVTINREASILIMTTEILRSMLYKGSDLLRDVDSVVFDECHYISDSERGVVWEESIILMPPHVNMVFLSATIPNSMEIASWIAKTKNKDVYIQYHKERPVPLVNCVYSNKKVYELMGSDKVFKDKEFSTAQKSFGGSENQNVLFRKEFWKSIIKTFKSADLLPCLMFSFSKKNCERFAEFAKDDDLINKEEKMHILRFFESSIKKIRPEDRQLPQVKMIKDLLSCGIGVHHGGMLPILKEIVEILLAEGYVKFLFCTSTFAMGINVPARSCAFTSLEKFNGKDFVLLTPTEYVQMSGRAGRRGLDTKGNAILIISNEFPPKEFLKNVFRGDVEQLSSQFQVTFKMVLSLLRIQSISLTEILRRSLSANAVQSQIPRLQIEREKALKSIENEKLYDCIVKAQINPRSKVLLGDIEDIDHVGSNFSYIVNTLKSLSSSIITAYENNGKSKLKISSDYFYVVLKPHPILVYSPVPSNNDSITFKNFNSHDSVNIAHNILKQGGLLAVFSKDDLKNSYVPISKLFNINSGKTLSENEAKHREYTNLMIESACFQCTKISDHFRESNTRQKLYRTIKEIDDQMKDESLHFKPMLDSTLSFLKRYNYITDDNVLLLKGRAAVELGSCDLIIATELLVNNYYDKLSIEEIAGLVSMFSIRKSSEKDIPEMAIGDPLFIEKYKYASEIANQAYNDLIEHRIEVEDDYVKTSVNPIAIQSVYRWAKGAPFCEIMNKGSDFAEGDFVRFVHCTNEILQSYSRAARVIGNEELSKKFEAASVCIKRDIIFAGSLYFD